jgi:type I restriction enzyme, R subunit
MVAAGGTGRRMTYKGESTVEEANLSWFEGLGYEIVFGPDIGPGEPNEERASHNDVILLGRLRSAFIRINPDIPSDAIEDAIKKVIRNDSPSLAENNRLFHGFLRDGVDVEYMDAGGTLRHGKVWLLAYENASDNDFAAINQFTVIEGQANRRPDIVVFVNGLPLAVIELKNAADAGATTYQAFKQLGTYKSEVPSLFRFNEAMIVSDGMTARIGSLTAKWDRFMPWRTIDGDERAPKKQAELQVLTQGVFEKARFLDLVRNFNAFEVDGGDVIKKLAGYHQYHAVNKAVEATVKATAEGGDRKAGVVWHTQGSGKSLTMTFFAGKIVEHPEMGNPTLVVLTDRNDLDDQLFETFAASRDLLRQTPVQAENREDLKDRLRVASGGVVFTTIQKFLPDPGTSYPELSDRRNILFIADEAHRSQYGLQAKVTAKGVAYGLAKHVRDALPNASFIGFTGTPVEEADRNTRAVFGDYVDVYDIHQAIEDENTVPIYYAARLVPISMDDKERDLLDDEFDDATEAEELSDKEKLKGKWARLEALVGAEDRVEEVAEDIVSHFEERNNVMEGKGMIVCMSRRICIELYNAIINLRPDWHDEDDKKGALKVIMTGSASDGPEWQQHIRNKSRRKELAERFKKPADPFKLVIVRDMWLTGFDAPCLHSMYIDKPMRGHGLMQAIARVNRKFLDKPGGLVVDYLGIGAELKRALAHYTRSDQEETGIDQTEALAIMLEQYEIVIGLYGTFDYKAFFSAPPTDQLNIIKGASEHILELEDGKKRYLKAVEALSRAYALAMPQAEAVKLREDVAFFQAVKATIVKNTIDPSGSDGEGSDAAIRQIISQAITTDKVVDIFAEAGMERPDISVLSDEFLAEVQGMKHKNLAMEALRKLLNDEIKLRERRNLVQARSFAEMLEGAIRKYHNRAVDAAQVIQELIELAKEMRRAAERGEDLGLNEDELAFYDALEVNDSAVQVLGDDTLKQIARELVDTVRQNTTIDWTRKESVKANLRRLVRRILKKYGYPPDMQETATKTVLEQAKLMGDFMAAE